MDVTKSISIACVALQLGVSVSNAEGLETFDQRRDASLESVWADYQANTNKISSSAVFWRAEALFELGKTNEACRLVNRGLNMLVPGNRENRWIHGGNSGFHAWPGIDCYVRYNQHMDNALKERYRKIYCGAVFYRRLSTSNHTIMAAVTRFLATQSFGADQFKPDPFFQGKEDSGNIFTKTDPTGEKFVLGRIQSAVKDGPGEYASRPYGAENILPLLTIAECASDPELRRKAMLAYEYCVAQLAPVYLRGHLATFAPRSYPDLETQRPWGVAVIPWVYFGGQNPGNLYRQWALRCMISGYRLPDVFKPAGTDRSKPYVHRAFINSWALYHYVNRSYVMFSRSPKGAKKQFYGQSYPCGVMWEESDGSKGSHLWLTNPAADDNTSKTNSPNGIHTHGVSKYEKEVQFKDATLYVFNIDAKFRNLYALGYVPGGYKAVVNDSESSGHIFLNYGSVLIALTSASPFKWDPASGIKAPASKPRAGDSEFRVMALRTAVAIETAHPSEFSGATPELQLESFRKAVIAKSQVVYKDEKGGIGRYTDRNGNVVECDYDGEDRINGLPVDYAAWPSLENPWMQHARGGSIFTVTDGKEIRTYDFGKWTVGRKARETTGKSE